TRTGCLYAVAGRGVEEKKVRTQAKNELHTYGCLFPSSSVDNGTISLLAPSSRLSWFVQGSLPSTEHVPQSLEVFPKTRVELRPLEGATPLLLHLVEDLVCSSDQGSKGRAGRGAQVKKAAVLRSR